MNNNFHSLMIVRLLIRKPSIQKKKIVSVAFNENYFWHLRQTLSQNRKTYHMTSWLTYLNNIGFSRSENWKNLVKKPFWRSRNFDFWSKNKNSFICMYVGRYLVHIYINNLFFFFSVYNIGIYIIFFLMLLWVSFDIEVFVIRDKQRYISSEYLNIFSAQSNC